MNHVLRIAIPLILLVLIIAGAMFLLSRHTTKQESCAEQIPQPKIVAFGDSLVAGYGATVPGGFVTLLSQQIGLPIVNLGKNGDTTADARARLADAEAQEPTITLVLLGGNDALQQVPHTETEQNLAAIIQELQKNGSKVVLLGVLGGVPDPYASMYARLSKKYATLYVPNVLSGIFGHQNLMSDGVHPNQIGYEKVAEKVLPILQKACSR